VAIHTDLTEDLQLVIGNALAFLAVSALVIVTPGPDTALTIRNSLLGGRAGAFERR
jgi:threonine/homoserine/homoserine lactone efflux protein